MSHLSTIDFHGDTLFAVNGPRCPLVAVKPISDRLGLDWSAQLKRTKRDAVLSEGMAMMTIPSPGGPQETACLPLHLLPGWLFGVDVRRVRADCRPAVLLYQRECYEVLHAHFFRSRSDRDAHSLPAHPARQEPVRVRRQLVTEARHVFGERAAGELWFALDMPVTAGMRADPKQADFGFTYTAIPTPPGDRPAA